MRSIVWADADYPVSQPWGGAPDGDGRHAGIDIGMVSGTPLFAARPGRVFARGSGYFALAVDGTFQRDWYLHIQSSMAYTLGTHVERGDAIASSGAVQVPGGPPLTGPHLHFEVQTGSLDVFATSLDPVRVLSNGLYGSAGDSLGDMFEDADRDTLTHIFNGLFHSVAPAADAWKQVADKQASNQVTALAAAVPAVVAAPVDLTPVLNALAAQKLELDTLGADVAAIKRRIEKDLAP